MKQTIYETPSEIAVNVFFVTIFIFHFISMGLIYVVKYIHSDNQPEPHVEINNRKSLKEHVQTIQAQNRVIKETQQSGRFTIS
tara:strand:- start:211 stop:459 length:249 start_codon:yes stop_codon:yes gene_type:complete